MRKGRKGATMELNATVARADQVEAVREALLKAQPEFPLVSRLFERSNKLHRLLPDKYGRDRFVAAPKTIVALRLDELVRAAQQESRSGIVGGIEVPLPAWLVSAFFDLGVWGLPTGEEEPMEVQRTLDFEGLVTALEVDSGGDAFSAKDFATKVEFEKARTLAGALVRLVDDEDANSTTLGVLLHKEIEGRNLGGLRARCLGQHDKDGKRAVDRRVYWLVERAPTETAP